MLFTKKMLNDIFFRYQVIYIPQEICNNKYNIKYYFECN